MAGNTAGTGTVVNRDGNAELLLKSCTESTQAVEPEEKVETYYRKRNAATEAVEYN